MPGNRKILSAQNYYPFGMIMPGRSVSAGEYRYGFNSMEQDDEWSVTGGHLDFGARIYDARLGSFLSVDPIFDEMPDWSTYHFAYNNPIYLIDFEGLMGMKYPMRGGNTIIGGGFPNHASSGAKLKSTSSSRIQYQTQTKSQAKRARQKEQQKQREGQVTHRDPQNLSRRDGTDGTGLPAINNPGRFGKVGKGVLGGSLLGAAGYLGYRNIQVDGFDEESGLINFSYEIEKDDTLEDIAGGFEGVDVSDIVEQNEIEDPDHIEAGDTLEIDAKGVTPKKDDDEGDNK